MLVASPLLEHISRHFRIAETFLSSTDLFFCRSRPTLPCIASLRMALFWYSPEFFLGPSSKSLKTTIQTVTLGSHSEVLVQRDCGVQGDYSNDGHNIAPI